MTGAAPRTAGVAQEPADVAGAEDAGGRRVSALLERVIAQAARLAESATGSADVRGAATAAGVGRGTRAAVERAAEERLTEPAVYEAPERNVGIGKGGRVPRGVAGGNVRVRAFCTLLRLPGKGALFRLSAGYLLNHPSRSSTRYRRTVMVDALLRHRHPSGPACK